MLRIRILTVVWGERYVDRFLRLTLRSLLAPGNLPDLAEKNDVVYELHTLKEDAERVRAHPVYQRLSKHVRFRFNLFSRQKLDTHNPMSHWVAWTWGLKRARSENAYLITVAADHIFQRGALMRWATLFDQGYLAIYSPGIQVAAEFVTQELAERNPGDGPIDLSAADMHGLMFRHLHPVMMTMLRESPRMMSHPEFHLRGIPGEGFVQCVTTSHAVAFHTTKLTVTPHFGVVDHLDRVAFEPSWFLSAEPILKCLNQYFYPCKFDDLAMSRYGLWAHHFLQPADLLESEISHRHPLTDQITEASWRQREWAAREYIDQLKRSRSIFRFSLALDRAGLMLAARWLTAAHILHRLRRHWRLMPPLTVFVPTDTALARLAPAEQRRLLGRRRDLLAVLNAHVSHGHHTLRRGDRLSLADRGQMKTGDGRRWQVGRSGEIRVLKGPIVADGIQLYTVDQPLAPLELLPRAGTQTLRALKSLLNRWRSRTRQLLVQTLVSNPRLYRLALYLRHGRKATAPQETIGAPPDAVAMELYHRAIAAQCLNALLELSEAYVHGVLGRSGIQHVPTAYLSKIKRPSATMVLDWLKRASQRAPEAAEIWVDLGLALERSGDNAAAFAAFEQALKAKPLFATIPNAADIRSFAAARYFQLAREHGSLTQADSVVGRLTFQHPVFQFSLERARALMTQDQYDSALATIGRSLSHPYVQHFNGNILPTNIEQIADILDRADHDNE